MEREQFLSDEEIINSIVRYLDDKIYNYAVMIDGAWGTGKSYFVTKKLLDQLIKEEQKRSEESDKDTRKKWFEKFGKDTGKKSKYKPRKFVYVSLFGIKDTEEISRLIFAELCKSLVKDDRHDKSKVFSWVAAGTKIFADIMKNNGVDLSNAAASITNESLLTNCVLIFDDLERICCDINEVLGYLNNLVEQEGLKVLIIANEKEICNRSRLKNDPDELLFCLNDKIDYSDFYDSNTKKDNTEKISIKELEERAGYLFPGNRNYYQIKEKLIGVTIKYYPNYYELIETLTERNIEDPDLKKAIISKKDRLYEIASYYHHYNLRTYLFFLSKCVEIFNSLPDKLFIERILEYIFLSCIKVKTGLYDEKMWANATVGSIPLFGIEDYRDSVLAFKFIDDCIVSSRLVRDEIKNTVNTFLSDEKKNLKDMNDPVNKLQNWPEMEEIEVKKYLDIILENLGKNQYSISSYSTIIQLFFSLDDIGFPKNYVNEMYDKMKKNIMAADVKSLEEISSLKYPIESLEASYNSIISRLNSLIVKRCDEESDSNLNSILDDTVFWGDKLLLLTRKNESQSVKERQFINRLDVGKLLARIAESDSHNISSFRTAIKNMYSPKDYYDFYRNDYFTLSKILSGLLKLDTSEYDLIKRQNIKWLCNTIREKMELFARNMNHTEPPEDTDDEEDAFADPMNDPDYDYRW